MTEALADLIIISIAIASFFGLLALFGLIWKLSEMDLELKYHTRSDQEIRLDKFAISCGIHVLLAKWYLNSKTRQLNGIKEVDDLGDVFYLFGDAKRKYLQAHLGEGKK